MLQERVAVQGGVIDGTRFIILDTGDVQVGNVEAHNLLPGFGDSKFVFHGHLYPTKKQVEINDFTVRDRRVYPFDNHPLNKAATQLQTQVLQNTTPYLAPGVKSLLSANLIAPDWVVSGLRFKPFYAGEMGAGSAGEKPPGTEDDYMVQRDKAGKELTANYDRNYVKKLSANRDKNPSAWFMRYGEWVELQDSLGRGEVVAAKHEKT